MNILLALFLRAVLSESSWLIFNSCYFFILSACDLSEEDWLSLFLLEVDEGVLEDIPPDFRAEVKVVYSDCYILSVVTFTVVLSL